MKIALCLSGQPRNALLTAPVIKKFIIDYNQNKGHKVDVFMHMHYDPDSQYIEKTHLDSGRCYLDKDIDEKLKEIYHPKMCYVEKPHNFNIPSFKIPEDRYKRSMELNSHRHMTREQHRDHTVKQLISMYYSIFRCNDLKEMYAISNGFEYDYVIRLRYDACPLSPLDFEKLNIDDSHIHYQEMNQPDNLISDWIGIGNNLVMNVYASIFWYMKYLNSFKFYKKNEREKNTIDDSDECGGLAEHMLRDIMWKLGIPKKSINLGLKIV